jgi:hypothetical protein
MISNLSLPAREVSDAAGPAPWSALSWGVFVPAVFAGNVVLAIFAWFVAFVNLEVARQPWPVADATAGDRGVRLLGSCGRDAYLRLQQSLHQSEGCMAVVCLGVRC